jgi:hypothetical protein
MYQVDNKGNKPVKDQQLLSPAATVLVKPGISNPDSVYTWLGISRPANGIHPLITNSVRQVLNDVSSSHQPADFLFQQPNSAYMANIYTEAYIGGRLFRCHPAYQAASPWYDWAMVTWEINIDDAQYQD